MPLPLLVLVPAGAAIGVAAAGGTPSQTPAPSNTAPNGGAQISKPSSGSSVMGAGAGGMIIGTAQPTSFLRNVRSTFDVARLSVNEPISITNPLDPAIQQKLDEVKSYARAAYDKLSGAAKAAAAKALNDELDLDPPLKGDESFDEMMKRIAAPAAAKAGSAVGEALGGPAGAALGQVVGKYLGGKLEDLLSKNSDEIKAWFTSHWADIENWVKDHVDDIEQGAKDVIDYLGSVF